MTLAPVEFGEWVATRRGALLRTAYLLTADTHDAEDLVQSALERVSLRWQRIAAGGAPEPYVRRVLYHQHVSSWRRHRGRLLTVEQVPEATVADEAGAADLRIVLDLALRRLTAKQRAVLVLRFYEDLSESQTADVLGVGLGTVKSQTRHALGRLRVLAPELRGILDGADDGAPDRGADEEALW
ncbi:MAG: SigE family RNA polymerase sigma factor [Candidatus Nanopelagicales bacterium]